MRDYNLNNPIESSEFEIHALKNFKMDAVEVIYKEENGEDKSPIFDNTIAAIHFLLMRREVFLSTYLYKDKADITTEANFYSIKPLNVRRYEYKPEENLFRLEEEIKLNLLKEELDNNFSQKDFEDIMIDQALSIIDNKAMDKEPERRLKHTLKRYFKDFISFEVYKTGDYIVTINTPSKVYKVNKAAS